MQALVDAVTYEGPQPVVARCVEEFGSIDVLTNNRGIYPSIHRFRCSR